MTVHENPSSEPDGTADAPLACLYLRRITLLLLCLAAGDPRPANADWLLGAYVGAAHTASSDVTVTPAAGTPTTYVDVEYRSESFRSPVYYGYRVAWFPRAGARVGIEAELIHLKVFANVDRAYATRGGSTAAAPMALRVQSLSMSHGLNFLLANAVARMPLAGGGRLQLVARAGVGPTLPHGESVIDGVAREGYQWAGVGLQASAGVLVQATRRLALTAEYKLTRAVPVIDVAGGTARIPSRSHHVTAGLSLALGR